jgi:hypothetical protein
MPLLMMILRNNQTPDPHLLKNLSSEPTGLRYQTLPHNQSISLMTCQSLSPLVESLDVEVMDFHRRLVLKKQDSLETRS